MARSIPEHVITDRLSEIDKTIEELKAEKKALSGLLKNAVEVDDVALEGPVKLGASKAVISHIRANPGLTASEIVKALQGMVDTEAKNPARVVFQTIHNLRAQGEVLQREGAKLYLPDQAA